MLQHAFLIMVHKSPELLQRIVSNLADDNHHFLIHLDKKVKNREKFESFLTGIPNIRFVNPISVHHGRVSQIYCELLLLREALKAPEIDYFHLISGQDYPLRSNQLFNDFFEKHKGESFAAFDSPEYFAECADRQKYILRTDVYYLNNKNNFFGRILAKFTPRLQLRMKIREPYQGIWAGWNWKSLYRPVVDFMLRYFDTHPDFIGRFNHTACCDELYFQTLFRDTYADHKINRYMPLRYVSWHPTHPVESKQRPYIMDERDFDHIFSSRAFFCRKVDLPQSERLLDMIDLHRNDQINLE